MSNPTQRQLEGQLAGLVLKFNRGEIRKSDFRREQQRLFEKLSHFNQSGQDDVERDRKDAKIKASIDDAYAMEPKYQWSAWRVAGTSTTNGWISKSDALRKMAERSSSNQYKQQVLGKFSDEADGEYADPRRQYGGAGTYDQLLDKSAAQPMRQPQITTAAELLWQRYGGVVLCECDDADCDREIAITHDQYIRASGREGFYRLTHSDCHVGVLGYILLERTAHYWVWSR